MLGAPRRGLPTSSPHRLPAADPPPVATVARRAGGGGGGRGGGGSAAACQCFRVPPAARCQRPTTGLTVNPTEVTDDAVAVAVATLGTVESFGIGYGQGAGASAGDWMKPPGDLFLYSTLDMKDLTGAVGDMVFCLLLLLLLVNSRANFRAPRNCARLPVPGLDERGERCASSFSLRRVDGG